MPWAFSRMPSFFPAGGFPTRHVIHRTPLKAPPVSGVRVTLRMASPPNRLWPIVPYDTNELRPVAAHVPDATTFPSESSCVKPPPPLALLGCTERTPPPVIWTTAPLGAMAMLGLPSSSPRRTH